MTGILDPKGGAVFEVHISARSIEPFEKLLGPEHVRRVQERAKAMRAMLGSRAIWNVSSTAAGGGVAEMLRSVLRYARGLGIDIRWLVFEATPEFFRVTKRVHNALHASAGDGSPLGPEQISLYERAARENLLVVDTLVRPGDIVICHDPQTAGLVPHLVHRGVDVVWRCHIGYEAENDEVDRGWGFLRPYLQEVPVAVFSRAAYAPPWLRVERTIVLPPNIDPFSAKNEPLTEETVRAVLADTGLVEGLAGSDPALFARDDGSVGRVDRKAEIARLGTAPKWETPLVVQVSRWDATKDPIGVLQGFARLAPEAPRGAQLVLAGPSVDSVADDPEGERVFSEVEHAWRALPDTTRRAVHLALLPMADPDENAVIVNALQRHAAVIVQKSLHEGFGLTVTEALWKRRPVVASAVGGIQDQIRDGVDGLLLHDPTDQEQFARLLWKVLADDGLAKRLADAGYERVRESYLSVSALERWADLLAKILR